MKKFDGKLRLLAFLSEDIPRIQEKGDPAGIERQTKIIKRHLEEIHEIIFHVQELRFENGDESQEIREWSLEAEENLTKYEKDIETLQHALNEIRSNEIKREKEEEEKVLEEIRRRRFEEELKLEEAKLNMKRDLEKKRDESFTAAEKGQVRIKLPKLIISKFQGTFLDWQRFWNQFETEVDKADIAPVSKFSYLKESLITKVRLTIDGLPMTTEGYERAKQILKARYGKPSEVANAHIQTIISLPTIYGSKPLKVQEFYEKLVTSIQTLETMGKLREMNGYVRMTLDKLPGIRADLVRTDDDWQEWGFSQFVEAFRKWCERNAVQIDEPNRSPRRDRVFQTSERDRRLRNCVYCDKSDHRSTECSKTTDVTERKKVLSTKKLCFNCTGAKHRAADCHSKSKCQKCNGKHHTSICDQGMQQIMLATSTEVAKETVTYPVVVVKVNGIKCRALLDTGAGSSYASSTLVDLIGKKPLRVEHKRIEMMMNSVNKKIKVYDLSIANLTGDFMMTAKVSKVEKNVLLHLPNPNYESLVKQYKHLRGVEMDDKDKKSELPIHLILGATEYSRIKTTEIPRIGLQGEPIAELTSLGWTMMSPGSEIDFGQVYLTRSSIMDYEQLCSLDVLGLKDNQNDEQQSVYEEFKEQLVQKPDRSYETGLLWKTNHPPLHNHKTGSLKRLENLVNRLQQNPVLYERYDEIIKDQLAQGIVEIADKEPVGREFYIPHKAVVRDAAESTKVRIVFDASAKTSSASVSLNECLETGPPLQNLLWNVLIRNRLRPIALAGDLKQAFLQVGIREADRDALRFHWIENKDLSKPVVLRFTRALFGLAQSPFLLGGTIEQHLENCKDEYGDFVAEIKASLYVDDVITGGNKLEEVAELKEKAIEIFAKAKFQLHKWHSNKMELEDRIGEDGQQSYAKENLAVKPTETKLLGLNWNKQKDTLAVTFPVEVAQNSKRGILTNLASIFDPLVLASPVTLVGKLLFRECCEQSLPWDKELPKEILNRRKRFEEALPESLEYQRSLCRYEEPIDAIDLHAFGDSSGGGSAAVVYVVIYQRSGISQGLLAAKGRLAKKGYTIPRLELVSAHMAANMVHNVKLALKGFPIRNIYGWLDSTVALHWINGEGNYKQFVANRVKRIREKAYMIWRHVRTNENPADIASRGAKAKQLGERWWKGPEWLSVQENWPEELQTEPIAQTEAEAKAIKEVLSLTVEERSRLEEALEKHGFWITMRITAWINRFVNNCKKRKELRISGPLTAAETERATNQWVQRVQANCEKTSRFNEDKLILNLQKNADGLYECRGRIQGNYPIFLPFEAGFSEELVKDAHLLTIHGGVGLTMELVRRHYWIPKLRQLVKRVINKCYGCKRFHAIAFLKPPEGNLPRDRTEGTRPFQIVGIDYAGPILYRHVNKLCKAYILLVSCSLTRAIHLELVPNQKIEELTRCLKRFVARRGRQEKIYSDNGRTFVAGAKWIRKVMKEEKLQDFLAHQEIKWQFNLSRAPWWGGQFERMVGLVKQSFYKCIGRANLSWKELEEVLLDVEVTLNNRPLSYIEDDIQLPILTPNVMIYGQSNLIPEEDVNNEEEAHMRKRAKYLKRCKDTLWRRWTGEYISALRERHNLKHKTKGRKIKEGDVVLIKGEERNRGKWKIGIVVKLIRGRDGIVRAAKLRTGTSHIERAVQHLYPMELECDIQKEEPATELNPQA